MRLINKIIIHCAATKPSMDIGAKEIDEWHRERGWAAIGYTNVIRRDGTIEKGRDLDNDGDVDEEVGAHAKGFNANSIGVCLVGGMAEDGSDDCNFTMRQYLALSVWIMEKQNLYPHAEVLGHRDLPNVDKTCPMFDVRAWMKGK